MSDRGNCPDCGGPVEAWGPIIEAGRTVGPIVEADRVVGWVLAPCGHMCRHVEWTRKFGHRFFNDH